MHLPHRLRGLVLAATVFTTLSPVVADARPLTTVAGGQDTLSARDLQGHAVALDSPDAVFIYDHTLDVTWLRQASAPALMDFNRAIAWAQSQVIGGHAGWRLPRALDTGAPGCVRYTYQGGDCGYNVPLQQGSTYNELAHLFHATLGNLAVYTPEGVYRGDAGEGLTWGLVHTGPFQAMAEGPYWTSTAVAGTADWAFAFNTRFGLQSVLDKPRLHHVMLVRDGDVLVSDVPEPGAGWLLAAGILLLAGWSRRQATRRS